LKALVAEGEVSKVAVLRLGERAIVLARQATLLYAKQLVPFRVLASGASIQVYC